MPTLQRPHPTGGKPGPGREGHTQVCYEPLAVLGPRSVSAIEARTLPPYQPRALSAHTGIKSWPTGSQMSCMNFGQGSAHTPITHSQGLPTRLSRAHCLGSHAGSGTPSLPRGRAGGVHTCSAPCWPPRQPAPLCGEQAWEDKQGETGRGTLAARTHRYPFCPTGCSRSPPPTPQIVAPWLVPDWEQWPWAPLPATPSLPCCPSVHPALSAGHRSAAILTKPQVRGPRQVAFSWGVMKVGLQGAARRH